MVSGLTQPRSIALDVSQQRMYWVDLGAHAVRSANMDGSGPIQSIIAIDGSGAAGLALDLENGKIYYTNANGDAIHNGGLSGQILRANLDGSNVQPLVTGLLHPGAIAVDPTHGHVYWIELNQKSDGLGSLQRADLDGSNVQTLLTGIDESTGLAIDLIHGYLYWTEETTHSIQRSDLNGSNLQVWLTELGTVTTIALSLPEGKMYWTESLQGQVTNRTARANLDGSGVETLVAGVGNPWGIAIEPTPVPEPATGLLAGALSHSVSGMARRRTGFERTHEVATS